MNNFADNLKYLISFSDLIIAYEEVAANRMQKTRQKVLYTRDYTDGLNKIYQQLKYSYKKQTEKYKKVTESNKNGKTAFVFISANSGLYGDLVNRVFGLFVADWQREKGDAVILGLWGQELFKQTFPQSPFLYFDMPDNVLDTKKIGGIIDGLKSYNRILVYHGLFRNIIKQDVVYSNITGDQLSPEILLTGQQKIIYEPSLSTLLDFFEKEIYSSLFTQAIFESQLAKFSSRMTALEVASQNLEKAKKIANLNARLEKHRIMNKKQLATAGRFFY